MDLRPLTDELKLLAEKELNETPETLSNGLKEINEFLDAAVYIKARRDQQFLVIFLRSFKYNIEKAKAKIDAHYKSVERLPEIFKDIDTKHKKFRDIVKLG